MKDWETRTFVRQPLQCSARDTFNDVHLPAEQLLAGLAVAEKTRKDRFFSSAEGHLKQAKSNVRGVKHPNMGDGTIFGRPSAEVHALLARTLHERGDLKFKGVESMLLSRAERHSAALEAYNGRKAEAQQLLHTHVKQASTDAVQSLTASADAIAGDFRALDRSTIMLLDEASLHAVWDSAYSRLPARKETIEGVHSRLKRGAADALSLTESLLTSLVRELSDVAHLSEGDIERILETEALESNRVNLANQRAFAQLFAQLHIGEVQLERARRQEFDAAVREWRVLRTQHAMEVFNARLNSTEFTEPSERLQLYEQLRAKQEVALASLMQYAAATISTPPLAASSQDIRSKIETAQELCTAWESTFAAAVRALSDHEEGVQTAAEGLYEDLVDECVGYKGYTEEELQTMISEKCGVVMSQRQEAAAALIQHTSAFLDRQAHKWRCVALQLCDFSLSVAEDYEEQKKAEREIEKNVRKELKRMHVDFESEDRAREAALEAQVSAIAQAPSEEALDEEVSKALQCLDEIENGYRGSYDASKAVAQAHPDAVRAHQDAYHMRICAKFLVVPKVEVDPQGPASTGEAGPGETQEGPGEAQQAEAPVEATETAADGAQGEGSAAETRVRQPVVDPSLTPLVAQGEIWPRTHDLYDVITADKPVGDDEAEPAAETEAAGDGAPAAQADEAHADDGEEQSPEQPTPDYLKAPTSAITGLSLCAELDTPDSDLRASLDVLAAAVLGEMVLNAARVWNAASAWAETSRIALIELLDGQLRAHRPRAGQIEEDARMARSVELLGQRRQVDQFIRAQTIAVQSQVDDFEASKKVALERLDTMLAKLSNISKLLYQCQSNVAVDIRQREAEKLSRDLTAAINTQCDALQRASAAACDKLASSNSKFRATVLVSFEDGGRYAPDSIAAFSDRVKSIDEHIEKLRQAETEQIEYVRSTKAASNTETLERIISELPPHREDLTLIEAYNKCMDAARRTTDKVLTASLEAKDAIDVNASELASLVDKAGQQEGLQAVALYEAIVQSLDRLRLKLLPRALSLQCLSSTSMEVRQMGLPIAAAGRPPPSQGLLPADPGAAPVADKGKKPAKGKGDTGKGKPAKGDAAAAAKDAPIWDPSMNVPASTQPLREAIVSVLDEARSGVQSSSQQYYATRDAARPITRPKQIKETLDELVELAMSELAELQERTERHVEQAVKELRAQVVTAFRHLLCCPSAALTALLTHELQHVWERLSTTTAVATARHDEHERSRLEHLKELRPPLVHPMRRAELRQLCEREDARRLECVTASKKLGSGLRQEATSLATEAEGRLNLATQLLSRLIDGCVMPMDLVPAGPEDDSLSDLKTANMLQLTRLELALKEVQPTTSNEPAGEGARPFPSATSQLAQAALSPAELGWTAKDTESFLGSSESEAAAAGDRAAVTISYIDTPVQRALVRAQRAAVQRLASEAGQGLVSRLSIARQWIDDAAVWQRTWNDMLQRLDVQLLPPSELVKG